VVFHRLRQQGLDELCCIIHDSQADKKAFVLNLKQSYESWLASLMARTRRGIGGPRSFRQSAGRFSNRFSDATMLCAMRRCTQPISTRELLHRLPWSSAEQRGPPLTSGRGENSLPAFRVFRAHS
jgi:hypothetical protein